MRWQPPSGGGTGAGARAATALGRAFQGRWDAAGSLGQREFLQLFLKNHYPLLKKQIETGRIISVNVESPANHLPEDARWDYRVTIRSKNSAVATTANPSEESMIKQLWPDQDVYKHEEQRRFEILLAHWDVPVTDITPTAK